MQKGAHFCIREQRGAALMEIVAYISVLVILLTVITQGAVQMSKTLTQVRGDRKVSSAAQVAVERIIKELRLARSVTVDSPSRITLNTFSDFDPDTSAIEPRVIELSGGKIVMTPGGDLTSDEVRVTNLLFTELDPADYIDSVAVRIEVALEAGQAPYLSQRKYYATAILQGSYYRTPGP